MAQYSNTMKFRFQILKVFVYLFACLVLSASAEGQVITTFAGTGTAGYNGDSIAATSAELNGPGGIAMDGANNLYMIDNGGIRKVDVSGIITTLVAYGASSEPIIGEPALTIDDSGNLYTIGGYSLAIIWKISPSGVISKFAGSGFPGYGGDGGPATAATFWDPISLATDKVGNVYIADDGYNTVRRVAPNGIISTCAGTLISTAFAYLAEMAALLPALNYVVRRQSRWIILATCIFPMQVTTELEKWILLALLQLSLVMELTAIQEMADQLQQLKFIWQVALPRTTMATFFLKIFVTY